MADPMQNAEIVEEWRVINDYPNYEVSNMGRVRRNGEKIFKGSKSKDESDSSGDESVKESDSDSDAKPKKGAKGGKPKARGK